MNINFLNTLPPGEKLQNGKYVIIEIFGQGYFSVTYLATQSNLNKRVIIHEFFLKEHCLRTKEGKVLNENLEEAIYKKFSAQWFAEAKILAMSSSNEHIATIMDTFEENGTIYYVTEYINEEDLLSFTLAKKEHRLTENQALGLIFQVADGLSFLHQNAIFHLDLSPAKILIDKSEKAVIVSFGIARQNIPNEIVSETVQLTKPGYSPPEFYQPYGKCGTFSDIYSLGAILYFLVTGKDPVSAPDRIATALPEPKFLNPSVSSKTNRAIMQALNSIPEERFQSVNDFVHDIHDSGKQKLTRKKLTLGAAIFLILVIATLIAFRLIFPDIMNGSKERKEIQQSTDTKSISEENIYKGTTIIADSLGLQSINFGKFYALLIGINTYIDPKWKPLAEPINDVNALKDVLVNYYTFDKSNVKILKNPVKEEIIQALQNFRDSLTSDDNLFVFYSGHGIYLDKEESGYIIPKDASRNNEAGWISYNQIKEKFRAMEAKHIFFVADACYAGGAFKEGENDFHPQIKERISAKSRTAFTSVDKKPTPDKSIFLKHLVSNLKNNSDGIILSEDLYIRTRTTLIQGTSKEDPVRWGKLEDCNDEGGDFVFVRRVDSIKIK